jgi:hypothetical protein
MEKLIIVAMFIQVILSLLVMIVMGKRRFKAAKNKQIKLTDFATMRLDNAGDDVRVADRNFTNQFEIPVLFYAGCLLALQLHSATLLVATCAWLFVITRVLHSIVHLTSNQLRLRFKLFLLGCGSVLVLWLALVWRIVVF